MAKAPSTSDYEDSARNQRGAEERLDGEDRANTEDRQRFLDEKMAVFQQEFSNSVLPGVPKKDGWHYIWLSTNNQYDPISRRLRMGYTPVPLTDVPEYGELAVDKSRSAQFEGMAMCNEMLLCRIPEELYRKFMHELHHKLPDQEGDKLRANIERMTSGDLSKGHSLVREIGDGTNELLKRPPAAPRGWQG